MDKIMVVVSTVLEKFPQVHAGYIHGSTIENKTHEDSDLDIAIMGDNLSFELFKQIKTELEQLFETNNFMKKIDLAIINKDTDPLFAHRVFNEGKVVFDANRSRRIAEETALELKYFDQKYFNQQMFEFTKERLQVAS